jgi:hypothetical protein
MEKATSQIPDTRNPDALEVEARVTAGGHMKEELACARPLSGNRRSGESR